MVTLHIIFAQVRMLSVVKTGIALWNLSTNILKRNENQWIKQLFYPLIVFLVIAFHDGGLYNVSRFGRSIAKALHNYGYRFITADEMK